eukprot:6447506-Pyramimonas_sp.AAC.1
MALTTHRDGLDCASRPRAGWAEGGFEEQAEGCGARSAVDGRGNTAEPTAGHRLSDRQSHGPNRQAHPVLPGRSDVLTFARPSPTLLMHSLCAISCDLVKGRALVATPFTLALAPSQRNDLEIDPSVCGCRQVEVASSKVNSARNGKRYFGKR